MLFLLIVLVITGCGRKIKENAFSNIKKMLGGLKSYTALANVEIYNNKFDSKFSMKQFYKNGKYRLEIQEEQGKTDKIIVYDGNRSYVYFSKVNQVFIEEDSKDIPLYTLITSFAKNLINIGEISQLETENGYAIKIPVPEGNIFIYKEEMVFSKKDFKPLILTVYNINDEIFARIVYNDFKYNPEIKDDLFKKDNVSAVAADIPQSEELSVDIKDVYKYSGINPLMPVYMTPGYKLSNISIDKQNSNAVNLIYSKSGNIIKITEGVNSDFKNEGMRYVLSDMLLYLKKADGEKQYITNIGGMEIKIAVGYDFDENEVIKILKSLK